MELLIIMAAMYLIIVGRKESKYISSLETKLKLAESKLELHQFESAVENPNGL